ncbi:MAG: protein translocase subunit SecD [Bacillota bacterium]|nr:protein translocase subunit SecD [Bacillota bacterium]
MKKRSKASPLLFILISLLLVAVSALFLFNWESYLKKGLDLEGGVYVLLEATPTEDAETDYDSIERAMTIIRNRIDELGVVEPILQREGDNRIRIELPGIEDQTQAMEVIGRTALLTFVSPEGDILLTGTDLKTAHFTRGQYNEPMVSLEFDAEGKDKFAQATEQYLGNIIAIFLDDDLVSAPVVQNVISDGNAVITGISSAEEASTIALMLRSGALPVQLVELETRSVGPTLGEDSLRLSFTAGIIGLFIVMAFMAYYYRFAGLIADISLTVYLALIFLILAGFNATITLPGIAGLILSIGMAVDANVLIYERIKEELQNGKTIFSAINTGFDRAFRAILDANITTVIAALVLFIVASGPVRGFAVVLLVGILSSVITAILLTRYLLRLAARSRLIKNAAYLGFKEVHHDQV